MATRYEYYNIGDNSSARIRIGEWAEVQTFTPQITHDVEYVKVKIYRDADYEPLDLIARIEHCDEDGKPNGEVMCSGLINVTGDNLTTNEAGEWKTIMLDVIETDKRLNAGTTYALILEQAGGG